MQTLTRGWPPRAVAVAVALVVMVGCSTNPATNVTSNEATLNGDGWCQQGWTMNWIYQIRDVSAGTGWYNVGPWHFGSKCQSTTSPAPIASERISGLVAGHTHQFRIFSSFIRPDGTSGTATYDAPGTNGGTNYDSFTTPALVVQDESTPEQFISDPDGGVIAAGCHVKEIKNVRSAYSTVGLRLWTTTLRTAWKYCSNGQISKMYPASASCLPSALGSTLGYECSDPNGTKVRAFSLGGNPEHAVYTYSFTIKHVPPFTGQVLWSTRWCSSNYISGSGAHKRTGSCDLQAW